MNILLENWDKKNFIEQVSGHEHMLRATFCILILLEWLIETASDKCSSLYIAKVRSEEEWLKSINYGNIFLEDSKCPAPCQLKYIKKMVTNVREENYKYGHVVDSCVEMIIAEDGTEHDEANRGEGFLSA